MSEIEKPKTNTPEQSSKAEIIEHNLHEIEGLSFESIETPQLDSYKSYRSQSETRFATMQENTYAAYKRAKANGQDAKLPLLTKKAIREIKSGQRELQPDDVYLSRIDYNQAYVEDIREIQRKEDEERGLDGAYDKAKAVEKLFVTYLNNSQFFDLNNETLKTRLASDYDDLENGVDIYSLIEGEPGEDGSIPSLLIAFDITSAKIPDKLNKKLTRRRHNAEAGATQITYYAKPGEDDPDKQQREVPKSHVLLYTLSLGDKSFEDVLSNTVINENGLEQNGIDTMPDLKLKFLLQIQAQNYYYLAVTEREIEEIIEKEEDYPPLNWVPKSDTETRATLEPLERDYDNALRWKAKIEKMISILEDSILRCQKELLTSDIPAAEAAVREIIGKPEGPLTEEEIHEGVQAYLAQVKQELAANDRSYERFTKIASEETAAEEQKKYTVQMRRRAQQIGNASQATSP